MKKFVKLFLFFISCIVMIFNGSLFVESKEIKYEMRGSSISFDKFDFKSKDFDDQSFKNYITENYDKLKDSQFNTIFLDISNIIDLHITGNFNEHHKELIKFAVEEGKKRYLEVHATFSDFSLRDIDDDTIEPYLSKLKEKSFLKDKSNWFVKFNDNWYLDPGISEVRDYFIKIISTIGSEYSFDGVFVKNMLYPKGVNKYFFNDSYSYSENNKDNLSKDDWRRQNTNDFVKMLGEKFKSYKNELKFGIGANYIWRNVKDDLNGIDFVGYSDYDDGCFDSLNLAKIGYANYIIINLDDSIILREDIRRVISFWEKKLRLTSVDMFFEGNLNIEDIIKEVRQNKYVDGFLLGDFDKIKNNGFSDEVKHSFLNNKVLVPRFKSFDSYYTVSDIVVDSKINKDSIEFNVFDEGFENTKGFVLYKFPYDDIDFENGEYIKDILPSKGENLKILIDKQEGVYVLTKINKNSIESTIKSSIIYSDSHGLIKQGFKPYKTKIVNDKVDFNVDSKSLDNEFKFVLEKNGSIIEESAFSQSGDFSWVFREPGIYKVNVFIRSKGNDDNLISSYLNVDVKDKHVVFLDPGHGGEEHGAKSKDSFLEKDINLNIVRYLIRLMEDEKKIIGVSSRLNDIGIDLSDRVKMCSFLGGDLFLSIHQNSFDNEKAHGIETYYYLKENDSKYLSEVIQKDLVSFTEAFDRGIKNSNFVVLRENIVPSVLIECGFISNENEKNKLLTSEYQESVSKAIYNSLIKYLDIRKT